MSAEPAPKCIGDKLRCKCESCVAGRQRQRAERALLREHDSRGLRLVGPRYEPRPSRADENALTAPVRRSEAHAKRTAVLADFDRIKPEFAKVTCDIEEMIAKYLAAVPGNHRDESRSLRHHMRQAQHILDAWHKRAA